MDREKNIVLVSHCLLNQNSVVLPLARAKGMYKALVEVIKDREIGILQLPCPEIIHLGIERKPMTKQEYDTEDYRRLCRELLKPIIIQLEFYKASDYNLVGIIGIDESPTCSLDTKGIMMEEFYKSLEEYHIELSNIAVPTTYRENVETRFSEKLSIWLDQNMK